MHMDMITVTGSSGLTHESVTLQGLRLLAVMLGLLLFAGPAVTFARVTPGNHNTASTRQLLATVDDSLCKTVHGGSGETAECGGDEPIPACCYKDEGLCYTNDNADGGSCDESKGALAGCCSA